MYRFAYLYVKLGYLLAGIILGLSLLFIGGSVVVLEFQKPRDSAASFNQKFAASQGAIEAQADTIERVFGLDQSLAALRNLRSRQWNSTLVSPSSAARLKAEYEAAQTDVQSLRQAVLNQLEEDIGFITSQLVANQEVAPKERIVATSPPAIPALLHDAKSIYASTNIAMFPRRILLCDNALYMVRTLQAEARSTDNKAALGRAGKEIEKFLQIIRDQENLSEQAEAAPASAPTEPSFDALAENNRPTRRDNVRERLSEMLGEVRVAITQDWNLDRTLETFDEKLQDFYVKARANGEKSEELLRGQLLLLGLLLVIAVLAFFIAVGSDLVKAILDSAVWLSHIYTNTANGEVARTGDEPPQ